MHDSSQVYFPSGEQDLAALATRWLTCVATKTLARTCEMSGRRRECILCEPNPLWLSSKW